MLQPIKKDKEGFTIIEVLIVLVIAGLIMLIVFLAVPALQRNSRNTSRRNDAGRISSAVTEVINNNNGQVPNSFDTNDVEPNAGDMSFYQFDTNSPSNIGSLNSTSSVTDADTFPEIYTNATCNDDGGADPAGSSRQFVVLYAVETGGSVDDSQCIDS